MHKFVRNLITEWRRLELPFSDATVVVAVSGGADSLSLLLALNDLRERKKLSLRFVAAHFNHRLRGNESEADEDFVKHIAAEREFELALGHGPIFDKGNLEQNARKARYEFLAQTAENLNAAYVLTAHTLNDQAETFLMNLIRGSGEDGLSAMRPVRYLNGTETAGHGDTGRGEISASPLLPGSQSPSLPFSSIFLTRPLLRWAKREDTEQFCRESGVEFRYDTMNEDMSFKRVRIRKMLIPMLQEFNPKIVETLARTAELLSESGVVAAGRSSHDAAESSAILAVREMKELSTPDLHQTLRAWLKTQRGSLRSISLKHIQAIENLIDSQKSGRTVELPGFGIVRKRAGRLSFEEHKG